MAERKDQQYKILCYLDEDYGRDVEIVLPVLIFAEKFLSCSVEFAFVWDVHAIYRKKPDLVFLPNTVGSPLYFQISKYAHQQGVKVFALISEGNFRTDGSFDYWGYNTDKQFYQSYVCHWSDRTYQFLKKELPELKDQMVFTGATGFDRYQIYDFSTKEEFLKRRGLPDYQKIVGYAGWAFGKLSNQQGIGELLGFFKGDEERLKWVEQQMLTVESMLREVIEANSDTLFILKRHPNEANPSIVEEGRNEMNPLKDYPNVLYINDKENIHDLINIADLWMGFETTTALEYWLLKRNPTILLNPDPDFNRDELFKGSVIVPDAGALQDVMDEFYTTGTIKAFDEEEKVKARETIIRNTIGYGDGFNHIRAAYYLKKVLEQSSPRPNFRFSPRYFIMYSLLHIGKYLYNRRLFLNLPKFKKTVWIFEKYRLKGLPALKEKYSRFLGRFYAQHKVKERLQQGPLFKNLIEQQDVRPE